MTTPIELLLSKLPDAKQADKGWIVCCPAHDDRTPSLSITEGSDGRVLVNCHAGCTVDAICSALNLKKVDLFPKNPSRKGQSPIGGNADIKVTPNKDSLKQAPTKTQKTSGNNEFRRQSGDKKKTKTYQSANEAAKALEKLMYAKEKGTQGGAWAYLDKNGEHVASVIRFNLPTPSGEKQKKTFRPISKHLDGWECGDPGEKWPLYNLTNIQKADRILLCEGEKTADAAKKISMTATTSAHGSQSPMKTDWSPLAGKKIMFLPDNDKAGRSYVEKVLPLLAELKPKPTVYVEDLPGLSEKGDLADWVEIHHEDLDQATQFIKGLFENSDPQILRSKSEVPMPPPYEPFPTELLPDPIRRYVLEAARALGCDSSYIVLPLLGSIAAAAGNSRRIELKSTWCEPCVLWTIVVGESGTLKSPAFEMGVCFLQDRQDREFKRLDELESEYRDSKLIYDADLGEWKRTGRKNGVPPPEGPVEPQAERLVCSDATVEAVAVLLADNPRGILLARDEMSGWVSSFDAYKSARGADAPHWLSMHRAGNLTVDRKTGRRVITVPRAAVSIAGGVQPGILKLVLGGKGTDSEEEEDSIKEHLENGLTARFLMVYPPTKAKRWTDDVVSANVKQQMESLFDRLLELEGRENEEGEIVPIDVPLDPTAQKEFITFYNEHAEEQVQLQTPLAAAWSKLEGYAARFALIIHLIRISSDANVPKKLDQVDVESMQAGIAISRWFCDETVRIYAVIEACCDSEGNRETRAQNRLAKWIKSRGGVVTAREVQQGQRRFKTASAAQEALNGMVKKGLGRWVPTQPGQKGRPTRSFVLAGVSTVNTISAKLEENGNCVDVDDPPSNKMSTDPRDEWGEV